MTFWEALFGFLLGLASIYFKMRMTDRAAIREREEKIKALEGRLEALEEEDDE